MSLSKAAAARLCVYLYKCEAVAPEQQRVCSLSVRCDNEGLETTMKDDTH